MTRTEQLEFCKICKNQQFDPKKGIVCNRTGEIADFSGECEYYDEDHELKLKRILPKGELRDNATRSKLIINVFIAICIINLIAVISGYFEFELLERIVSGGTYTENEISLNDLRQGIIGLIQGALYISSIILFLNWFRRAYWNLHQIGEYQPQYNDSMTIWGFAIPFINLYRPFKMIKEIVDGLTQKLKALDSNYTSYVNNSVIGFWWALFLITNFVGQIAFKAMLKGDTIEQLIHSTQAYLISDALDLIAAILTAIMIKQISKDEVMVFNIQKITTNIAS